MLNLTTHALAIEPPSNQVIITDRGKLTSKIGLVGSWFVCGSQLSWTLPDMQLQYEDNKSFSC